MKRLFKLLLWIIVLTPAVMYIYWSFSNPECHPRGWRY